MFLGLNVSTLLGGTRAIFGWGLILPCYLSKTLLGTLPDVLWIARFSSLAGGNRYYLMLCRCWILFPLILSSVFSPWPWVPPFRACIEQHSFEDFRGILCRYSEFSLCSPFSSPVLCPASSSHLGLQTSKVFSTQRGYLFLPAALVETLFRLLAGQL